MDVNLTTHVSGLASGMDTEKIVSDMMKVNRMPLDKLQQEKTINTWKTEAYREINTKIDSFRTAMQDLRLEGTFTSAQKVTSSDDRVAVSLTGKTAQTSLTITEAQLAKPAKGASVSFDTKITDGSASFFPDGVAPRDLTFTINGKEIKISKESNTFDKAIAEMKTQLADKNITVDNVGGSLVFSTTDTGADKSITITGFTGADTNLNIVDGTTDDTTVTANTPKFTNSTNGSNIEPGYVDINGTRINISSNMFTYDNIQINLKQDIKETNAQAAISITPDTDKVFDKIKTFVDKYNELIKDLDDKLSEKKYRDYPPLTDDQKKAMKDDDIKLWEEKAKSGLLANDPTIRQFLTQLRTSIGDAVEAAGINTSFKTLKDIGITTTTNYSATAYKENGKLYLDETKLKSLLTSNLGDIQKLFASKVVDDQKTNTITSPEKYSNSGIGVRVYERIGDVLDSLKVIAGAPDTISLNSNLAKEAASYDKRIAQLQDSLNTTEQNLWKKFNAMEEALQKLNSQSSWIYQQLG
ncbi:flagellar filament capping protein FliD [Neobacillus mesonae]|uniref:flagellar filament capping protein FliD n=1 Tax=Neobacillus mesonae TaxID=1193713 RepID=UPI002040B42C|nr:flagellar filament capping protein FliD [Neobacillus mesonae]MCM3566995.1 flagellar filament capping protein FliD [Neobacillus mesonae]